MAETSKIEWTDSTFNPWVGCTKIAPACDHCYAEGWAKRSGMVEWGNNPRRRTSESNWREPLKWQRHAPVFFAEHGRRRRVFCASLADVFDNQVPPEWRADLWALIRDCPDLDWLLLTKRPQNIAKMKPAFWDEVNGHVWLGTTVEDQEHADQNIPHLLQHDSAVRFISAEPLLGPIDLTRIATHGGWYDALAGWRDVRESPAPEGVIDWVIVGGESGPDARPMHPDWTRSLRDQCASAGVPFLFKQWGEWAPGDAWLQNDERRQLARMVGSREGKWNGETDTFRVGKKAAGRLLDGIEHNGFPGAA